MKSSTVSLIFFWDTAYNIYEKVIHFLTLQPHLRSKYRTCKMGRNVSKETRPSVFWFCTRRRTSASVGFWPARRIAACSSYVQDNPFSLGIGGSADCHL